MRNNYRGIIAGYLPVISAKCKMLSAKLRVATLRFYKTLIQSDFYNG